MEAHESFKADYGFVKLFEASAKDRVPQEQVIHVSWRCQRRFPAWRRQ